MSRADLILDVGTTGVKAFVFDARERILAKSYLKLKKTSPRRGWVEQDPEELILKSRKVMRRAVKASGMSVKTLASFGLTTQRETTILWNRKTGRALGPAIVWEDVRTRRLADRLNRTHGRLIRTATGLTLDPYFSGTKISWFLHHSPDARRLQKRGHLAFGTVDAWLLRALVENHPHLTDRTNASRTLCYDLRSLRWSPELLRVFGASKEMMPEVRPSTASFGRLRKDIVGIALPVRAVTGDQQASLFAAGIGKGVTKITFGTGIFLMQDIGTSFALYDGFFTTLAAGGKHQRYAVETKIGNCAARVEKVLRNPKALEKLMDALAKEVSGHICELPIHPRFLVVDGGATRDGIVARCLQAHAGIPVRAHHIFDGTALGTLRMLREPSAS